MEDVEDKEHLEVQPGVRRRGLRNCTVIKDDLLQVITHESFLHYLRQTKNVRSTITYMRAVRQFGTELPPEGAGNPIRVRCASGSLITLYSAF